MKPTNLLNPYKIAINNYNKSVRNNNPREFPTKNSFFNSLNEGIKAENFNTKMKKRTAKSKVKSKKQRQK